MLRLLSVAISIGLADSLNPTTVGPALFLASGEQPRRRVLEFTLAVFAVYLVGGLIIALGPGRLLLSLIPIPHSRLRHLLETAAGLAVLVAALLLWRHRARLAAADGPDVDPKGRSSWILGATITAIELPTAFPYFAAIAAIVGGTRHIRYQVVLIVIFNLCFVLPLLAILVVLVFAGDQARPILQRGRDFLQAHWPRLLAGIGLLVGLFVVTLGVTGIASSAHTPFGRFMRRLHRKLPRP